MKNKDYLKMIIALIIIIVVFSSYKITSLKKEIKELKESRENLYDQHECYDMFYDNENLVILHVNEEEEYCKELLEVGN